VLHCWSSGLYPNRFATVSLGRWYCVLWLNVMLTFNKCFSCSIWTSRLRDLVAGSNEIFIAIRMLSNFWPVQVSEPVVFLAGHPQLCEGHPLTGLCPWLLLRWWTSPS
jgi:hypothetical protein